MSDYFLSMFEQVKVSDRESSIICAKEAAWAPCRLVTFPFCRSVFGAKLATLFVQYFIFLRKCCVSPLHILHVSHTGHERHMYSQKGI